MRSKTNEPVIKSFLYCLFRLLKDGAAESCSCVEERMSEGLANYLCKKYPDTFSDLGFDVNNAEIVDDYFRDLVGVADGNEYRKHDCKGNEGLWLALGLAIDAGF